MNRIRLWIPTKRVGLSPLALSQLMGIHRLQTTLIDDMIQHEERLLQLQQQYQITQLQLRKSAVDQTDMVKVVSEANPHPDEYKDEDDRKYYEELDRQMVEDLVDLLAYERQELEEVQKKLLASHEEEQKKQQRIIESLKTKQSKLFEDEKKSSDKNVIKTARKRLEEIRLESEKLEQEINRVERLPIEELRGTDQTWRLKKQIEILNKLREQLRQYVASKVIAKLRKTTPPKPPSRKKLLIQLVKEMLPEDLQRLDHTTYLIQMIR
jgi:hypothetical protein